jgi:hypothetical protein
MLDISARLPTDKPDTRHKPDQQGNHLARLRREARQRGFRVLKDWTGTYSLVDARIEPQRALCGLLHTSLHRIELALAAPLPAPKPRRRRTITVPTATATATDGTPDVEADHPLLALVEALKAARSAS